MGWARVGMHGGRRRGRDELKGSGPPRQWPEHLPSIWLICAASFAQCKGRNFSDSRGRMGGSGLVRRMKACRRTHARQYAREKA